MKESVTIAKEADTMFSPTKSNDKSIHRVRNEPERQLGSLMSVIDSIRSDGGTPSVGSIATELSSMPTVQRASVLLALQQTHGNRYVQRVVAGIQAKLKIGQPGDIYEQEADRVADAVMRMPEPQVQRRAEDEEKLPRQNKTITPIRTLTLQRQDDEEEEELKKKKKEEEEEEILQTNGIQNHTPEVTPDVESRIQAMRGSGQPLPEITRALMGQRFGYDFSQVRVHTGGQAAETAKTLNARAFTVGQDIVFGAGQYAPSVPAGQRLVAHELTHVVQQNVAKSTTQRTIQRNDDEKSKLQKLDEMLSSVDVPEEEVIILLGQLSTAEKATVLRGYKERIANALNIGEMVRAVSHLNPILTVKLNWVRVAATYTSQIDYSDIKGMITSASQPERDALKTDTWRDFFVEVCTNKTMVESLEDLEFDLETKLDWMRAETVSVRLGLDYADIKDMITSAPKPERDALKTATWRDFFIDVCDNATMKEAVIDLGFDLVTKLDWMVAEGTNADLVRGVVAAAPIAEVLTVRADPVLSALLAKEVSDTDVLAERLAQEVLSYIQSQAATRAAAPPSIDPTSRFYKALKDKYLKDYLAAPSPLEGTKAVERIGKPMQTRRSSTDPNIIEVQPEGGAWRPAENRWEKGAELFWNKQKVPDLPSELRNLPLFQNIKTLPSKLEAGTGLLIRENLTDLPYLDVPFLLGIPNTSTATLTVDVIKGGKNLSQLMHWATGVKYSSESPKALRELFLAYEKWHLEGWDVFGQDALNDLIAEEQGRLLGKELQKGSAGEIKSEADLLPFLNRSFLRSRAWIGALLRHRRSELDAWILSKEQKPAKMHWGALPEAQLWPSRTIYQMFAEGESIGAVKSSSLVVSQIEIYTLLFEADRWESAHGPIDLTDLEKALLAGNLDAILAWKAKGGGLSGAGAASEERRELKGGP